MTLVTQRPSRAGLPPLATPAAQNRQLLADAGIFAVDLCGGPGSGKTSLIRATLDRLSNKVRTGVIVAHPAAVRDAALLEHLATRALAIEVGAVNAAILQGAINTIVTGPHRMDLLFIENPDHSAGLGRPDIGQSARVAVFSVAAGDDKAAEYPERARQADLILLTKTDLLPYVNFDVEIFRQDVLAANPGTRIIELSSSRGDGMDQWIEWLTNHELSVCGKQNPGITPDRAEWWFG